MITEADSYRLMIQETKDYAIFMLDPNGYVTTWNVGAERIKGYKASEIIGKHISIFYTPEDIQAGRPARILSEALANGRTEDETWRVRKDGSRFWANVVLTALYDPQGQHTGFGKITRDLTERRQAEEALHKQEMDLAQSRKLESLGQLAGGIAHDFNNILAGIMGVTQEVLATFPPQDERVQDLELVIDSARRAFDMTKQLLAFSRRQVTHPKVLSVNETIRSIGKLAHRLIGEDVKLTFDLGSIAPIKIDSSQLEQVLLNLIVNARDAVKNEGSIHIRTYLSTLSSQTNRLLKAKPGNYVTLEVRDTGYGMDENTLAHIFEPYFTTKESGKGTGLGLATVYGIVQQACGDIEVVSAPRKGATFRVYFPVAIQESPNNASAFQNDEASRTASILLVEDEPIVRYIVDKKLQRLGYRTHQARNGQEALDIVREKDNIDIILTDVVMPKMNGRQLVEAIREIRPGIGAVYMSGYPEDVIASKGVLETGVQYLDKSELDEKLGTTLNQLLREQEARL